MGGYAGCGRKIEHIFSGLNAGKPDRMRYLTNPVRLFFVTLFVTLRSFAGAKKRLQTQIFRVSRLSEMSIVSDILQAICAVNRQITAQIEESWRDECDKSQSRKMWLAAFLPKKFRLHRKKPQIHWI